LQTANVTVTNSDSILAFATTGSEHNKVFDRFLTIEGRPAYHIGNICGTCSFLFERLEGANTSISAAAAIPDKFSHGLKDADESVLNTIKHILPDGEYVVSLLEITPASVLPGSSSDYFTHEQVALWGIDGFWNLPHHPKIEYYRSRTSDLGEKRKLFEFIIPMFPPNWLQTDVVDTYKKSIASGQKSTALALSVLDIKQPAVWNGDGEPEVTEHWCLAHYLLDGHHKMFAASAVGKPITLLSFLSLNESIATAADVLKLMGNL